MDYLQTAAQRHQERVNAWTHGLGLALGLLECRYYCTTAPPTMAPTAGGASRSSVFHATHVYFTSTLYHSVQEPRRWKYVCRQPTTSAFISSLRVRTPFWSTAFRKLPPVLPLPDLGHGGGGPLYTNCSFFGSWEWLSVTFLPGDGLVGYGYHPTGYGCNAGGDAYG